MSGLVDLCQWITDHSELVEPDLSNMVMYEIGAFAGESAEVFSRYFSAVHCVDPWKDFLGDYTSLEEIEWSFDERVAACGNIVKHKGTSEEFAPTVEEGSLDFVYIDGNHDYESVRQDIALWTPKVRSGGFVGGHDYGQEPGVTRSVIESFVVPEVVFADMSWIVSKP
jgi:hypothetical protein